MRYLVALGISLGVHALGLHLVREIASAAPVRSEPSQEAIDIVVMEGDSALPQAVSIAAPVRRPRAKRRQRAPSRAAVAVVRAPDPGSLVPVVAAASPSANAEETDGAGAAPQVARASSAPPGSAQAPGALDLRPFFARLQAAAQHCAGAREGHARVRFCVDGRGQPSDVSLVQSSGDFALDDAALHCVLPGFAPLPLTDRCLVVPLVFR